MSVVYLLCEYGSSPERYKIGITRGDVEKRIKQLQTGSSNEITLISTYKSPHFLKIESLLHTEYSKYSTDGGSEWFELPTDEVFCFKDKCNTYHKTFESLIKFGNPFI
jgi:hypothetical protein